MNQLPRFWLTAFWGFEPEHEGYYGFTLEGGRSRFLREYQDGDLVLIYGADVANTAKLDRKQLLGILKVQPTPIWDIDKISDFGLSEKKQLGKEDSWRYAVPVRRAWRIDQRIGVKHLIPDTYDGSNGQALASFGQVITSEESKRILQLRVTEVNVFGEPPLADTSTRKVTFETAYNAKSGPAPSYGQRTSNYVDGEAFAYVMELTGDLSAFLGKPFYEVRGKRLIKIGFSNDPARRLAELNCGFPSSASIRWTERTRSQPYADGASAFDVEQSLHEEFGKVAARQGNEIYLCDERFIDSTFAPLVQAFRLKAN